MQTMNISLPDPMKEFVEEQVTAGDYSSASEYMRELVRAEQKRRAKEQLEQTLLAALAEGSAEEATPELLETLRRELGKRAKARQTATEKLRGFLSANDRPRAGVSDEEREAALLEALRNERPDYTPVS